MATPELTWETIDGETYAYHEPSGAEINITGRIPARAGLTVGTNVRTWTVLDAHNDQVASATVDGLRDAKSAAVAALTDYLAATDQADGSPTPS